MPVDAQVLPLSPTQRLQTLQKGRRARLRCLEMDGQLELVYLLHRQVGGRGTFENLDGIKPVLPVNLGEVLAVTQHAAGDRKFAKLVDGRQPSLRGESDDAIAPDIEI